jgi:hypothetical protein
MQYVFESHRVKLLSTSTQESGMVVAEANIIAVGVDDMLVDIHFKGRRSADDIVIFGVRYVLGDYIEMI